MEINQLIKEQLGLLESAINVIEEQFKLCTTKQSQLDMLLVDIYHEIELQRLSAPEMMSKYKELRAVLKLRRKYKNMLEYINVTRASINIGNGIQGALKGINTLEKREDTKKYHHRIKQDLREEILSEIE